MRELHLRTTSPDDTRRLAATVAGVLRPGDVVSLTGELGAGKTCFVQGAAVGLGVDGRVTSPTFLLRRDYAGRVPVVHLDVYRLDSLAQVEDLGDDEIFSPTRVTFVEWGDAVAPLLPAAHLEVALGVEDAPPAPAADEEPRHVVLRGRGAGWARRMADLDAAVRPWAAVPGERP